MKLLQLNKDLRSDKNAKKIIKNIINFYNDSINHNNITLNWYDHANKDCKKLARKYGVSDTTVFIVVSILSPANAWGTNLEDADQILFEMHGKKSDRKYRTYPANVIKAKNYMKDRYSNRKDFEYCIEKYLKTPKIFNFFHSLQQPNTLDYFCVDRHMITIAGIEKSDKFPTTAQFKFIAECYIQAMKKVKFWGGTAYFQAYLWHQYQIRIKGISHY